MIYGDSVAANHRSPWTWSSTVETTSAPLHLLWVVVFLRFLLAATEPRLHLALLACLLAVMDGVDGTSARAKLPAWEIAYQGEIPAAPHKTWTKEHIPTHQHTNVHRVS
eukprot:TRINITY_DN60350_c0_g1_i1.p1 TRINITY_DN60350_c0_g1~~TRINITY_DN60350_c0_g1_i1.p1  ORF type:complete len:109 (-),score=1.05 TRINITY_DN60350_c0_g1_i1:44-370(-)